MSVKMIPHVSLLLHNMISSHYALEMLLYAFVFPHLSPKLLYKIICKCQNMRKKIPHLIYYENFYK